MTDYYYYFCNQCWSGLKCHSIFIISVGYLIYSTIYVVEMRHPLHLFWVGNEIAFFPKFYGKVILVTFPSHLKKITFYLYRDFDSKSWIVDFFTSFTREKTLQNNFSHQNFSVVNNYIFCFFLDLFTLRKVYRNPLI